MLTIRLSRVAPLRVRPTPRIPDCRSVGLRYVDSYKLSRAFERSVRDIRPLVGHCRETVAGHFNERILTIGSSVVSAAGLPPPGCDRDADLGKLRTEPSVARGFEMAAGLGVYQHRTDFRGGVPGTVLAVLC